jgi:hypothetical protein
MTANDTASESCATCRYVRRIEGGESVEMRCHRYAPIPISTIRAKAHWVYVTADDWCGEYRALSD